MTEPPVSGFLRRTLSSLRSRNFRLFFLGQTVSNTGNWLTMVALTLLVLHRTGSGTAIGVLSACQFGPILLLSLPSCRLAALPSCRLAAHLPCTKGRRTPWRLRPSTPRPGKR